MQKKADCNASFNFSRELNYVPYRQTFNYNQQAGEQSAVTSRSKSKSISVAGSSIRGKRGSVGNRGMWDGASIQAQHLKQSQLVKMSKQQTTHKISLFAKQQVQDKQKQKQSVKQLCSQPIKEQQPQPQPQLQVQVQINNKKYESVSQTTQQFEDGKYGGEIDHFNDDVSNNIEYNHNHDNIPISDDGNHKNNSHDSNVDNNYIITINTKNPYITQFAQQLVQTITQCQDPKHQSQLQMKVQGEFNKINQHQQRLIQQEGQEVEQKQQQQQKQQQKQQEPNRLQEKKESNTQKPKGILINNKNQKPLSPYSIKTKVNKNKFGSSSISSKFGGLGKGRTQGAFSRGTKINEKDLDELSMRENIQNQQSKEVEANTSKSKQKKNVKFQIYQQQNQQGLKKIQQKIVMQQKQAKIQAKKLKVQQKQIKQITRKNNQSPFSQKQHALTCKFTKTSPQNRKNNNDSNRNQKSKQKEKQMSLEKKEIQQQCIQKNNQMRQQQIQLYQKQSSQIQKKEQCKSAIMIAKSPIQVSKKSIYPQSPFNTIKNNKSPFQLKTPNSKQSKQKGSNTNLMDSASKKELNVMSSSNSCNQLSFYSKLSEGGNVEKCSNEDSMNTSIYVDGTASASLNVNSNNSHHISSPTNPAKAFPVVSPKTPNLHKSPIATNPQSAPSIKSQIKSPNQGHTHSRNQSQLCQQSELLHQSKSQTQLKVGNFVGSSKLLKRFKKKG